MRPLLFHLRNCGHVDFGLFTATSMQIIQYTVDPFSVFLSSGGRIIHLFSLFHIFLYLSQGEMTRFPWGKNPAMGGSYNLTHNQFLMLVAFLQNLARTFSCCRGIFKVSTPVAHETSGLGFSPSSEGLDTESPSWDKGEEGGGWMGEGCCLNWDLNPLFLDPKPYPQSQATSCIHIWVHRSSTQLFHTSSIPHFSICHNAMHYYNPMTLQPHWHGSLNKYHFWLSWNDAEEQLWPCRAKKPSPTWTKICRPLPRLSLLLVVCNFNIFFWCWVSLRLVTSRIFFNSGTVSYLFHTLMR